MLPCTAWLAQCVCVSRALDTQAMPAYIGSFAGGDRAISDPCSSVCTSHFQAQLTQPCLGPMGNHSKLTGVGMRCGLCHLTHSWAFLASHAARNKTNSRLMCGKIPRSWVPAIFAHYGGWGCCQLLSFDSPLMTVCRAANSGGQLGDCQCQVRCLGGSREALAAG